MKLYLKLALIASLFAATPSASSFIKPAQAAENATQRAGRAAIAAQYRISDAAILRKDVPTLIGQMTPDYKSYERDGTVADRAQNEAALRLMLSGNYMGIKFQFTKAQSKILSLTWRGPDAIVMAQSTLVGTGQRGNKSVRVEVVGLSREYWGKTARGWQVRQSVNMEMKRWINGVRDPSM